MANDDMLSQEEIDELLNVNAFNPDGELADEKQYLTRIEEDTIGEIGNISFGSAATTLSTILHQQVEITAPKVSVIQKADLKHEIIFEPVSIEVSYRNGFTGKNVFVIKADDAAIISDIMLGGDGTTPDRALKDMQMSAVQEAMNQMMGAAATSMSTIFDKKIDISPPVINVEDPRGENHVETTFETDAFVSVSFRLKVGMLIDSMMMQLMPIKFAKQMVAQLLNGHAEEMTTKIKEEEQLSPLTEAPSGQRQATVECGVDSQLLGSIAKEGAPVQRADFSEFDHAALNQNKQRNLDMLLDIPLKVTVELGRTKRTIKDILDLSQGSIIELDKLAGEPVDILVNETLIAQGEVVVIDENFGVRVTDIMSQSDRIKKIK
jgi:flagellar motor switch protein FliN/FliY